MIYKWILILLMPVSPFGWVSLFYSEEKRTKNLLEYHMYFCYIVFIILIVILSSRMAYWIPKTAALFG